MPTPEQLSNEGHMKVWPHKLALGRSVVRNIYISATAEKWIANNLKQLQPDGFYDGVERPREQLADVFRRVMIGENINEFYPKTVVKHPDWIHELRTADLRMFGWFWRSSHFIVALIMVKKDLADNRVTYDGCFETCRAFRSGLDLDPPKFIEGEIDDILGF